MRGVALLSFPVPSREARLARCCTAVRATLFLLRDVFPLELRLQIAVLVYETRYDDLIWGFLEVEVEFDGSCCRIIDLLRLGPDVTASACLRGEWIDSDVLVASVHAGQDRILVMPKTIELLVSFSQGQTCKVCMSSSSTLGCLKRQMRVFEGSVEGPLLVNGVLQHSDAFPLALLEPLSVISRPAT